MPATGLASPQAAAAPGNGSASTGRRTAGNHLPRAVPLQPGATSGHLPAAGGGAEDSPRRTERSADLRPVVDFLHPAGRPRRPAASAGNRGGSFDLEPQRLEAVGTPAVLSAPSDKVYAVGEQLQYDFQLGRISLGGTHEISLQQGLNEIHARNVQYQAAAPGHRGAWRPRGPAGCGG